MRQSRKINFTNILRVLEIVNREFDDCNAISFDDLKNSVVVAFDIDVTDAEFDTAVDMLVGANLARRKFCNDNLESVFSDDVEGKFYLIKTNKCFGFDEDDFCAFINKFSEI